MAETVPDCATCGDPKTQHKLGKGGCRNCEFGCAEFVPETAAQPAVEPVPAEELAAAEPERCCVGEPAMGDPDGLHSFDCPVYLANVEALKEFNRHRGSAAADLDLAKPDPGAPAEGLAALADLRAAERERDDARSQLEQRTDALNAEIEAHRLTRADLAEAEQKRDEFWRGRSEATERALELAAELADVKRDRGELHGRIGQLAAELEHAEQYARDLQDNGDVPATTDHLLDQADATGDPAVIKTSTSIRGLLTRLREQLAEHDRREGLRARERELLAELADIQRQLGQDAAQPAADTVPDKVVRVWARENGFEVPARGGVPLGVRAAYLQAQST